MAKRKKKKKNNGQDPHQPTDWVQELFRFHDVCQIPSQYYIENILSVQLGARSCSEIILDNLIDIPHTIIVKKGSGNKVKKLAMRNRNISLLQSMLNKSEMELHFRGGYGQISLSACVYKMFIVPKVNRRPLEKLKRLYQSIKSTDTSREENKFDLDVFEEANHLEASLIGIPGCCRDEYFKNRLGNLQKHQIMDPTEGKLSFSRQAKTKLVTLDRPIEDIHYKLLKAKGCGDIEKVRALDEKILYSYFVDEIFPCIPGCWEAAEVGYSIHCRLDQVSPLLGFVYEHIILPFNVHQKVLRIEEINRGKMPKDKQEAQQLKKKRSKRRIEQLDGQIINFLVQHK